jgi:hypothetical protein
MQFVLQVRHSITAFNEFADYLDVGKISRFKASTIVEDELAIISGNNFGVDIGFARFEVGYTCFSDSECMIN